MTFELKDVNVMFFTELFNWTVGYNSVNNLVLPGHWWVQNLIPRPIHKKVFSFCEPFRLCDFKEQSAKMSPKCGQNNSKKQKHIL